MNPVSLTKKMFDHFDKWLMEVEKYLAKLNICEEGIWDGDNFQKGIKELRFLRRKREDRLELCRWNIVGR